MNNGKKFGVQLLSVWVGSVQRHSLAVLITATVLAGLCLNYTMNNLGMNTDTLDMLSSDLPWRQLDNQYKKTFPQYRDRLVIVIEAPTPDQASDAADFLHQQLLTRDELYDDMFYKGALPPFTDSALLYLGQDELEQLADDLAHIQPFLARLTENPTLAGLFAMLRQIINAMEEDESIEITPLLNAINTSLAASETDPGHRLSWQALMTPGGAEKSRYREFILLKSALDYSSLMPADDIIKAIGRLRAETKLEERYGVKLRVTGGVALQHEELLAVTEGTQLAMGLALLMVTCILLLGLRSVRLLLFTIFSLLIGLIVTAAFATLTVGQLNLISVAFTVLYIGLGVDFAIHFCLRYQEHIRHQASNEAALTETATHIGSSLFICALSTAVGFFSFMPTDYQGVAELGWIAGFGMFFSFLFTLTLLPALLTLFPLKMQPTHHRPPSPLPGRLGNFPGRHSKPIIAVTSLLLIAALIMVTDIRFDPNTLNLQDPNSESLKAYRDLLADKSTSPWTAIALAQDRAEAEAMIAALSSLDTVDKSRYLHDFIPAMQDEKLAIIDELGLLLGELDMTENTATADPAKDRAAIDALLATLAGTDRAIQSPALMSQLMTLQTHLRRLQQADDSRLTLLKKSLLDTLPGRIKALKRSLDADYITLETLPAALRKRWLSDDGHYRIEIFPRNDLQDGRAMREFVERIQAVNPQVTGSPVVKLHASDSVAMSFKQAFLYALIVITLILLLLCRQKTDVIFILAPMLMAAVFTAAITTLLGMPLNFANVIALPLLLGIGVDSGIHIMHRFRTDLPADGNILHSSTARGVFISALTTMVGIGNLAISPHAGTASMGILLACGIGMTMLCMLVVLPALLSLTGRQTVKT